MFNKLNLIVRSFIFLLIYLVIFDKSYSVKAETDNQFNPSQLNKDKEKITKLSKEVWSSYERGMKLKKQAENSFKESDKYGKMSAWIRKNAKQYDKQATNTFLTWLKKETAKGNVKENYTKIISTSDLLKKYSDIFLKKHYKIYNIMCKKYIKTVTDVTDNNMWLVSAKTSEEILK